MVKNNPFFSKSFTDVWLSHFGHKHKTLEFESIYPVKFLRNRFRLYYYNVGKNITNGVSYVLSNNQNDCKGKVFMTYCPIFVNGIILQGTILI